MNLKLTDESCIIVSAVTTVISPGGISFRSHETRLYICEISCRGNLLSLYVTFVPERETGLRFVCAGGGDGDVDENARGRRLGVVMPSFRSSAFLMLEQPPLSFLRSGTPS